MKLFVLLLLIIPYQVLTFELISGTTFLVGAVVSYYYGSHISKIGEKVADIALCTVNFGFYECCGKPWITSDISGLKADLHQHVFGQHIATGIVISAIGASIHKINPSKPLVMSFHGWPGSGKNYIASFIVKNYFKNGENSHFYHYFNARIHFPLEESVPIYQEQLRTWISYNVTSCPYSIFVFDEVDKMPAGLLDGIKPFLDHHQSLNGVDYRRTIFILLSNTGGNLIIERYLELWKKDGKTREQMTLADFEDIINKGAFNEKGGLQKSDVIDHNLIDHYVPFLPLERNHVEQCVKAELSKYSSELHNDIIKEAMKIITYGPKPEALFSNSGCKRLSQKVAALVHQKKMNLGKKKNGYSSFEV